MIPASALHRLVAAILDGTTSTKEIHEMAIGYGLDAQDEATLFRVASGEGCQVTA